MSNHIEDYKRHGDLTLGWNHIEKQLSEMTIDDMSVFLEGWKKYYPNRMDEYDEFVFIFNDVKNKRRVQTIEKIKYCIKNYK